MSFKASSLMIGTAIGLAMSGSAWAQDSDVATAPETERANPNEIIVTAQKREQSINDVGAPIVALGGEALVDKGITSPADLAQIVPGLNYSPSNTGTTVYTLRGVGFTDGTLSAYPDVTVYLDQIPLPFPVLATLTNFDLSRAEVLVGPQGTLFGANATGGAINYIAETPTSTFEAGTTIDYGRFNSLMVDAFVSGPIADGLNFRLAGRAHTSDDWQYSYTRDDTNGSANTWALRGLLEWEASDRLTFNLNVNGWRDKTDPQQPQFYKLNIQNPGFAPDYQLNYPVAPFNPRAASWDADLPLFNDTWLFQTSLRTEYELGDNLNFTALSSFIKADRDAFQQNGGADFEQSMYGSYGEFESYFQELRLDNGASGPIRWTVGVNYAQDDVDEGIDARFSESSVFFATGLTGDIVSLTQDSKSYAAFGNVEVDVLPTVTLKGGLRYTETTRKGIGCVEDIGDGSLNSFFDFLQTFSGQENIPPLQLGDCVSINPATGLSGEFRDTLKEDNISFRAGVDWQAADDLLVYANISRGYKAGGFPSLGASTWTQFRPVNQETVLDYEVGFKAGLLDNLATLTATAFYYDYTDKQLKSKLIDPVFGALDGLVNIPKSSVKGAEMSFSTAPISGLTPSLSVTYLDATIDEFFGVNAGGAPPTDFSDTRMPFASKWSVNAGFGYQAPVSQDVDGILGLDVTYRSATNALVGNPVDYTLPAYTLLDLRAGLQSADGDWKVMLYGKNVTNKYYITNVALAYDHVVRFTGMPRTYGIRLSYNF